MTEAAAEKTTSLEDYVNEIIPVKEEINELANFLMDKVLEYYGIPKDKPLIEPKQAVAAIGATYLAHESYIMTIPNKGLFEDREDDTGYNLRLACLDVTLKSVMRLFHTIEAREA